MPHSSTSDALQDHLEALRAIHADFDAAHDESVAGARGLARLIATTQATRDFPEVRTVARNIEHVADDHVYGELDRLIHVLEQAIKLRVAFAPARGKISVLVAEDDRVTSSLIVHRLERERYLVKHVTDGPEAVRLARERAFDIVVLDVKMPGIDGFEVLKQLRELPGYEQTPILMLTALGGEDHVVRGLQMGANDYIAKPFSPLELMARIQRLLKADGS
ncbi:MAG TPA: response regulator [Gemmatimonadales bacterium]|jgi:CheY-like chemotaxis protein